MKSLLLVTALYAASLSAQSAGCNRAAAIVEEVKGLIESPSADHHAILDKLRTANQLCPTLGEAWKYAYCSASALGDDKSARMYKDRAIFNGVSKFDCGGVIAEPARVAPPLPAYVRQKYALVIGIGKFADASIPQLHYAAKDAKDFAALLTDPQSGNFPPENVTLLTNEQATRTAIFDAMQELFLRAHEDDLVVTYVSSHGSQEREEEQGLAGVGSIVTYNTDHKKMWLESIQYQDFAEKISLLKARRKVTFLDTCFSGQVSRRGEKALVIDGMNVNDKTAKMFLSGEGTFVIMSSRDNERSWESEHIQNSYFTHFLIEGLRRSKEPPTIKEVFDYIALKVPDAVARDKQAPQHPQLQSAGGIGDLRIGVVPRGQQ